VFYNAKDYGAVGDGTTDDTTALQTCLNAVAGKGVAYIGERLAAARS
jgi:polygalacturonase